MQDYLAYPAEMGPKESPHCLGYPVREEMLVYPVPLEYLEEKVQKEALVLLESEDILVKKVILACQDFLGRRELLDLLEERGAPDFLV